MPNIITLETKLSSVAGIAPKLLVKLKKMGMETVHDLLWHFPVRYEDYSRVTKIADLKPGDQVTIRGEIRKITSRASWKSHISITEALVTDETGGISIIWFNQPYLAKNLREGTLMNFAGKVFSNKTGMHLSNPSFEALHGTSVATHTAGLIAIYPETRGLTSKGLRYLIKTFLEILEPLPDFLPEEIRLAHNLPDLMSALRKIHFPKSQEQADRGKFRFAFEYVFLIQLSNIKTRTLLAREQAPMLTATKAIESAIIRSLPFTLTQSQEVTLTEILSDIAQPHPMNRLVQGDVGSGKTAVAAVAAMIAAHAGWQAIFMAPTEVLARQHYHTITTIFKKFEGGIGLLMGAEGRMYLGEGLERKQSKVALLKDIGAGRINIIIGTHALIAEPKQRTTKTSKAQTLKPRVTFSKPGLIIIDEQHRFGVKQRAALLRQNKESRSENQGKQTLIHNSKFLIPHFLSMSATPIPRTLSLAIFGDLDVSTINELPKGRKVIITKIVDPENRPKAYGFIKQQIEAGRQVFFIYPRIEAKENEEVVTQELMTSTKKSLWNEVKTVKAEFEKLSKQVFPYARVAMLHGKLKTEEKARIMASFKAHELDILVSTSVIEVGVDVPNATIMVIEGADRFGLAQLYQFRGRVGRGEHQSFCFLFTDSTSETTMTRLTALLEAKNGFELAEKDLEIRGPGQFLGDKQTGVPDFAMKSLSNMQMIKSARDSAQALLTKDPELTNYPLLAEKVAHLNSVIHLE